MNHSVHYSFYRLVPRRQGPDDTATAACKVAIQTLAANPADIPFALIYLLETNGQHARLLAAVQVDPALARESKMLHTGTAAIETAGQWRPEIILCDLGLPGIDGYETCRRLRQLPGLEKTVIAAVSGSSGISGFSFRLIVLSNSKVCSTRSFQPQLLVPLGVDVLDRPPSVTHAFREVEPERRDGRRAGKRSTISQAARGNSQLLQAAMMYAYSGLGTPMSPAVPEIRRRATAEQIKT
jgi:CheY-like chemotaxis protein